MSHAHAAVEQESSDQGWDVEQDEESSGVFSVLRRPVADVAIGEMGRSRTAGEPAPVYAVPYVLAGKDRVRYTRDYYLGTRFVTGIIPAEGWDDEMKADGVPASLIAKCRAHLIEHAL